MIAAEAPARREHEVSIGARRSVPFEVRAVYELLSDLTKHWPLLGGDLVEAGLVDPSEADSAELILRGPFPGVTRRVVTRVTYAVPESAFGGEAVAGSTLASIDWRLAAEGAGVTVVSFDVGIDPGGMRDRLLLGAARPWLSRRCQQVLERLERELSVEAGR
ncbi:MAG: SRPBCC family protein [Solirubrobacterales bacterium]